MKLLFIISKNRIFTKIFRRVKRPGNQIDLVGKTPPKFRDERPQRTRCSEPFSYNIEVLFFFIISPRCGPDWCGPNDGPPPQNSGHRTPSKVFPEMFRESICGKHGRPHDRTARNPTFHVETVHVWMMRKMPYTPSRTQAPSSKERNDPCAPLWRSGSRTPPDCHHSDSHT